MLTAEQIAAACDRTTVEVHVPEWACEGDDGVLVGTIGALDYAELRDWIDQMGTPDEQGEDEVISCDTPQAGETAEPIRTYTYIETFELMVRWCVYSILDPATKRRVFSIGQVSELGAKSFTALERVYRAALDINKVTQAATEAFEKNSERTNGDDSGGE